MEERGTLHLMGVTTFMYRCCKSYGNEIIVALDALTNVGFSRKDYVNMIHLFSIIIFAQRVLYVCTSLVKLFCKAIPVV